MATNVSIESLSMVDALKNSHIIQGLIEQLDDRPHEKNRFRPFKGKAIRFALKDESPDYTNSTSPQSQYAQSVFTSTHQPIVLNMPVEERPKTEEPEDQPLLIEIDPIHLGRGGFGCCYRANFTEYTYGSQIYASTSIAFKQVNMCIERDGAFNNEIEIMKKLSKQPTCENIIEFYFGSPCDIIIDDANGDTGQQRKMFHGIAMELCSGASLQTHLKEIITPDKGQLKRHIALDEVLDIVDRSFSALEFIHDRGIIHCDVKPDNMMWDPKSRPRVLKFIDFGLSYDTKASKRFRWVPAGTPDYRAPETLHAKVGFESDIWSFGITLSTMLLQARPYNQNPRIAKLRQPNFNREMAKKERVQAIQDELVSEGPISIFDELMKLAHNSSYYNLRYHQDENDSFYSTLMDFNARMLEKHDRPQLSWFRKDFQNILEEYHTYRTKKSSSEAGDEGEQPLYDEAPRFAEDHESPMSEDHKPLYPAADDINDRMSNISASGTVPLPAFSNLFGSRIESSTRTTPVHYESSPTVQPSQSNLTLSSQYHSNLIPHVDVLCNSTGSAMDTYGHKSRANDASDVPSSDYPPSGGSRSAAASTPRLSQGETNDESLRSPMDTTDDPNTRSQESDQFIQSVADDDNI